MNWFNNNFSETSISWLLIATSVSLLAGFISSWLTYRFVKRRELMDTQKLENEQMKQERLRIEVIRWSNPVLSSVRSLRSQLRNILQSGYLAMSKDYKTKVNPNWSISYDYFMDSLSFLFGQYFAWVQMLQSEMNFELFETQWEKDMFFSAIYEVSHCLSSFPPDYGCSGKDTQVFVLQQRAMGELMIIREGESKRCMSYPEFYEKMKSEDFRHHFQPLIALIDGISPDDDCRWKRLQETTRALSELEMVCNRLLNIQSKGD
ncbi:MAG: hypothetical protein U0X74_02770 [Anaerolineales bacterium]